MKFIATDSSHEAAKPPSVWKMLKAGCSHGELCSRFPSEDLRGPIIDDNIADDDILNEHLEKHKLEEWFGAALNAAQRAYDREQGGHVDHGQLSDGSVSEQEDDEEGEEEEPQTNGTNGVAAAQGGEDVEMQDQ
jgi:nuclear pore complex protein Nup133